MLEAIADKVASGERLSFDDGGGRAVPSSRRRGRRPAREHRSRAPARRPDVYFNRNMRIESRTSASPLASSARSPSSKSTRTGAHTMSLADAWAELEDAHGRPTRRDPHRQRPAPRAALLVLRGASCRLQAHQARHPHEMLHGRGDPLLREALRDGRTRRCSKRLRRAGLDSLPGGGAEIFHPEVRTRISHDKATADEYLEVAPRRAPAGNAHEHHDALWPYRDVRASGRPPAPHSRAARRGGGGLPGLHPVSRSTPTATACGTCRRRTAVDALRTVAVSGCCSTTCPCEGVLGQHDA